MPRKLSHKIADLSKRRLIPGTIIDAGAGYCSVRLGTSSKVYRGVPFAGGPCSPGQDVYIDMSSGRPIVEAYGEEVAIPESPKSIQQRPVNSEIWNPIEHPGELLTTSEIQVFTSGSYQAFNISDDGMQNAIDSLVGGGTIIVPPCTLSNDFSFPSDTHVFGHSHRDTIFTGELTFANEGSLFNATIQRTVTSGSSESCLSITGAGSAKEFLVYGCDLTMTQSGAGDGRCVTVGQNVALTVSRSWLTVTSSGSAYASYLDDATASALIRDTDISAAYLTDDESGTEVLNCLFDAATLTPTRTSKSDRERTGHYHTLQAMATITGQLTAGYTVPMKIYNRSSTTRYIIEVFVTVDVAPVGQSAIFDVDMNGTSIFAGAGDQPTITTGTYNDATTDIQTDEWDAGDYLEFTVDQVGTTNPGEDATIHVTYTLGLEDYYDG